MNDLNLLFIPDNDWHNGEIIFKNLIKAMDFLNPLYHLRIVGCFYRWQEKDDEAAPVRARALPKFIQAQVHASMVRHSPAQLLCAVIEFGHFQYVLFNVDIVRGAFSSPVVLNLLKATIAVTHV